MTRPRDAPASRRSRANGDGTVYQRKDDRWEAAGYVLAPGNTRKRVRVYGTTRKEALAKLTAKDVRTWLNELRTVCQCCARGIDARRKPDAQANRRPRCCAIGECCRKYLSPLTLAYIHSGLKSALEDAVREEEIPRNVARNVRTGTPRPRRFDPLTAVEARTFLAAASGHRLHALFELALRTGLRKGELLGLRWEDLDLDNGTASIRRTLQRTRTGGLTALPTN